MTEIKFFKSKRVGGVFKPGAMPVMPILEKMWCVPRFQP